MSGILFFTAVMVILAVILSMDFYFGRRQHIKTAASTVFPKRKSNLELFTVGQHFYERLFEDIENSTHSVHVLFYIIKNDPDSESFLSLLQKKAEQGISVRLLADYVGSHELENKKIQQLKESGISFAFAHRPKWPFFFYSSQTRNHRKITVIDGRTGYTGGFNIGKEYLGKDPKFGFWRDYHLRVTGEGVRDLQRQFLTDWNAASDEQPEEDKGLFPALSQGRFEHRFLTTPGMELEKNFLTFIKEAKKELLICSPYFIPGKKLMKELLNARNRGVSVKIMVPMKADHPLVKEASFPYFGPLLKAGCDIYQYYYGFYHAKVIVVDDGFCDIGTANFDKRSLFLNDEFNCLVYDSSFVKEVKLTVVEDMKRSAKLTLDHYNSRSVRQRVMEKTASFVSYFL